MSEIVHGTFTIERNYPVAAAKVFAAWADPVRKARWFAGPDGWTEVERGSDFRVGGREVVAGRFSNGGTSKFVCTYHDIVPDQRIVYAYDMFVNGTFYSVSLATIALVADGATTTMRVTEQGAFFQGASDAVSREQGTIWLIEKLGASLT